MGEVVKVVKTAIAQRLYGAGVDTREPSQAERTWARVQVMLSHGRTKEALALALEEEARTTFGPDEGRSFGAATIMPLEFFPVGWGLFIPAEQHVVMEMLVVDEFYMSDVMWRFADRLERMRQPELRRYDVASWRRAEGTGDED